MPIVIVNAIEGRTVDQKRAVAKEMTEVFARNYGVPPEAVSIIFNDMPVENYAKAGVLRCDSIKAK